MPAFLWQSNRKEFDHDKIFAAAFVREKVLAILVLSALVVMGAAHARAQAGGGGAVQVVVRPRGVPEVVVRPAWDPVRAGQQAEPDHQEARGRRVLEIPARPPAPVRAIRRREGEQAPREELPILDDA